MKTRTTQETYDHLCNLLDNNKKVYYGRFGDGDFYIMNGKCEKMHYWSQELADELFESFKVDDPLYVKGAMINYPLEPGMSHGLFAPMPTNKEIHCIDLGSIIDAAVDSETRTWIRMQGHQIKNLLINKDN